MEARAGGEVTFIGVALLFVTLLLLIFMGIPIAYALGISGTLYILFFTNVPLDVVVQILVDSIKNYHLVAVALFILTGALMNSYGITDAIFQFANTIVGHLRGGLAHVSAVSNFIFAGSTGSAVAETAGVGRVEVKAMVENGYRKDFAAAVVASSAILGPIVPPSIPLVVYAMLAEESIGRLFLGGIVPGITILIAIMIVNTWIASRNEIPVLPKAKGREVVKSLRKAIWALLTPVILIGGILTGVFTPTEAAGVAAVYAYLISFIYHRPSLAESWGILRQVAVSTGSILLIFAGASVFAWAVTVSQLPQKMAGSILSFTDQAWVVLLLVVIFYLVAGMFLDPMPIILISVPIFLPLIHTYQINLVHFGLISVLATQIGLLTPPVGINLFIVKDIAKISFDEIVKATIPFVIALIAVLMLLTFIPGIVLWLPDMLIR